MQRCNQLQWSDCSNSVPVRAHRFHFETLIQFFLSFRRINPFSSSLRRRTANPLPEIPIRFPASLSPAPILSTRAREVHFAGSNVHGRFLRRGTFWLQNCATQRSAAQISLVGARSEKQTAQHRENLRKNPLLNYKSAALPTELCRQKCAGS